MENTKNRSKPKKGRGGPWFPRIWKMHKLHNGAFRSVWMQWWRCIYTHSCFCLRLPLNWKTRVPEQYKHSLFQKVENKKAFFPIQSNIESLRKQTIICFYCSRQNKVNFTLKWKLTCRVLEENKTGWNIFTKSIKFSFLIIQNRGAAGSQRHTIISLNLNFSFSLDRSAPTIFGQPVVQCIQDLNFAYSWH